MRLSIALIAIGAYLCCTGEPRADQASEALRAMCGPRGDAIADLVRAEAHRWLLHPALVASVIALESRCDPNAVGTHGEIGLGQLMPRGAAATSPLLGRAFSRRELRDPATNVYATARFIAWNMTACPKGPEYALTGYNQRHGCKCSRYARRVLGMLRAATANRS
jgi:soluble lytic murein transglycosylase-like protein